ncbi:MAG: prephenate dehydrogenase/arogenate dehydrogenase family protein, partial [Pseudobutyrivibrio sp.]|nr:prephenate dehydrogenase/arogenate dehydrogenase family protein [Pseudobutyrivibrio sp.]
WTRAKDYRDSITIPANPMLRFYELYCDIDDKPGTLVGVLQLLADAEISVKNIDIIHNREFEPGVLRIEFYSEEDIKNAQTILVHNNYYVRQRTN